MAMVLVVMPHERGLPAKRKTTLLLSQARHEPPREATRWSKTRNNNNETSLFRILYIVTSSSSTYTTPKNNNRDGEVRDRWSERIVPVVQHSVKSLHNQSMTIGLGGSNNPTTVMFQVDVYLILGYSLGDDDIIRTNTQTNPIIMDRKRQLQNVLPKDVGLEIWENANPWGYDCLTWQNEPAGIGNDCLNHPYYYNVPPASTAAGNKNRRAQQQQQQQNRSTFRNKATLQYNLKKLARQHRYVIKDKLPYYDMFLAFEDDMLLQHVHVKQHLDWRTRIIVQQQEQKKTQQPIRNKNKNNNTTMPQETSALPDAWRTPLTRDQWRHMKPGFLRVEVLFPEQQDGRPKTAPKGELLLQPFGFSNMVGTTQSSYNLSVPLFVNPEHCCDCCSSSFHTHQQRTQLTPNDLMIWEAALLGLGVRPVPLTGNGYGAKDEEWVILLPGLPPETAIPSFWAGQLLLQPQHSNHQKGRRGRGGRDGNRRPKPDNKRYLGQSAGWMATSSEILELDDVLCGSSFLPPFHTSNAPRDGYWNYGVEFWSGGLQMWLDQNSQQQQQQQQQNRVLGNISGRSSSPFCGIQRFIPLNDFDKHLIYHTSNNKQYEKSRDRLVLAQDLYSELLQVQTYLLRHHNHLSSSASAGANNQEEKQKI